MAVTKESTYYILSCLVIRGTTRVCPNLPGEIVAMQLLLLLPLAFLGLVASQDTYKCPDGWMLEEDRTGCRCFLIGPDEAVTRSTADLVCAGHSGSWVAELDHPGKSTTSFTISSCNRYQLLAEVPPAGGNPPW